ncbi:T-cell surface glycoprotein CD8 beta chain [Psammomys obesus]|uniref:T-cell surface glycoprotein CD8 beta chain n=1 Tax=Psammomys obesus TaxID=48139 RepID=UPI002452B008|nr:T-cell surface glycoprotein CD8 beta chain [Psammomys obesus]
MQPWLWLVFSVKLSALWSSSALIQTPQSMTVLTNQTAIMSCEAKTLTNKNNIIYWMRDRQSPTKDKHYEFLASWNPSKRITVYGEEPKKNIMVFSDLTRYIFNLTNVKPEDSGFYVCMMIGTPRIIFGRATELSVVDVLSTTPQTTKKTSLRKKQCPFPSPKTQKGLTCSLVPLSLLLAGILVLLVSLSVAVHFLCLRRKARIRFMKQFHK